MAENNVFKNFDSMAKVFIYKKILNELEKYDFGFADENEDFIIDAIKCAIAEAIEYKQNDTKEIDDTRWQACPWCKEKPVLHQEITSALKGGDPVYYMSCDRYDCGRPLIYYGASIKEAIEEWNSLKFDDEGAEE